MKKIIEEKIPYEWQPIVDLLLILFGVIVFIFISGWIIDIIKKDKYQAKYNRYRTLSNELGGGEEAYYKYWLWQRNKKKFYVEMLRRSHDVHGVYSRKAMQKNRYKSTLIPFRREVYCKLR